MFDAIKNTINTPVMNRVRMAYANHPDGDPRETIPGSNLLLPQFGRLAEAPQSMTRAGIHKITRGSVMEISSECETWAMACGMFCGLAHEELVSLDVVGEALRGTPADIPWSAGQYGEAVGLALQSLGISPLRSAALYEEGFEEARAIGEAIRGAEA